MSGGGACAGSCYDYQATDDRDLPITCWRLCPCCDTLQRVELGRMAQHLMGNKQRRETSA